VDGISQIFFCSTPKGSFSSTPFRFWRGEGVHSIDRWRQIPAGKK